MNLPHALRCVRRELEAWDMARMHEHVPLFAGGLMDWPAWAVDAIAHARSETSVIQRYLRSLEG